MFVSVHCLLYHICTITIKIKTSKKQWRLYSLDLVNLHIKWTLVWLRFLDFFRFLRSSINKLSQSLCADNIGKHFTDSEQFKLIRHNGVFPYSCVDKFSKLCGTCLPQFDDCYGHLRYENVSTEYYDPAEEVWNLFES